MDADKKKQIELVLLGIIAAVLIYQTYQNMSGTNGDEPVAENDGTTAAPVQPTNQPVTIPGSTGQTNPFQPSTQSQTLSQQGTPSPRALMNFKETDVDIGTVKAGTKKRHTYFFTNTGETDLNIVDVNPDEGLLIVSRPRDPIPPNGTGEILVEFLDNNQVGEQVKTIHINSNANPGHIHLTMKAKVTE